MLHTEEFIKRLEYILEHFGLSASAFADKVNVQRSSISHLLSGRNKPSLEFVMKVIDIFPELNLYWLLDGKGYFLKKDMEDVKSNFEENTSTPILEKPIDNPPTLFDKEDNFEAGATNFLAPENLFTQKSNGKSVEKIVLLFTDGSFKEYNPSTPK